MAIVGREDGPRICSSHITIVRRCHGELGGVGLGGGERDAAGAREEAIEDTTGIGVGVSETTRGRFARVRGGVLRPNLMPDVATEGVRRRGQRSGNGGGGVRGGGYVRWVVEPRGDFGSVGIASKLTRVDCVQSEECPRPGCSLPEFVDHESILRREALSSSIDRSF
jgi:hypothetical protein